MKRHVVENRTDQRKRNREEKRQKERFVGSIPPGCRACGGPYPNCCDSCPMFDD